MNCGRDRPASTSSAKFKVLEIAVNPTTCFCYRSGADCIKGSNCVFDSKCVQYSYSCTLASLVVRSTKFIETGYGNRTFCNVAVSFSEVSVWSFLTFVHMCTYIMYRGELFELVLICMSVSVKAHRVVWGEVTEAVAI